MRLVVLLSLVALCIACLQAVTAPALAESRYCLQGRHWGYPGNCAFATYAQCMATASGTNSGCGINPRYAFARRYGYANGRHWRH